MSRGFGGELMRPAGKKIHVMFFNGTIKDIALSPNTVGID